MSRKPIEEFKTVNYHTPLCLLSDTRKLEEEFQEVLDALCEYTIDLENSGRKYLGRWKDNIAIIEKATGEKWEDIK